jgi:hypothetical protein
VTNNVKLSYPFHIAIAKKDDITSAVAIQLALRRYKSHLLGYKKNGAKLKEFVCAR